ncbi:hypothetical protein ABZ468_43425 [Streptomyces sp. NPDC005708]|uniref:hypothetical protein n=1 Tax=Streptomyces sp. NPDC005708 TaxID=3154564 RepID=UPI0033EE719D
MRPGSAATGSPIGVVDGSKRRLIALVAEGVTVIRVSSADWMQLDDAVVELIEYDDPRGC